MGPLRFRGCYGTYEISRMLWDLLDFEEGMGPMRFRGCYGTSEISRMLWDL